MFAPITTDRLRLRPVEPDDAAPLAARRSQPQAAEYQSFTTPYPLAQARELVAAMAAQPDPVPGDWWMLTIVDGSDTVVGDLALQLQWDGRAAMIGYTLAHEFWGQGYATEAVEALLCWLFEVQGVTRVGAMLHPDNIASAMLLERTGFVYEGRTQLSFWVGDENTDDLLYGVTREGWDEWVGRPRKNPAQVRLVEVKPGEAKPPTRVVTHKSQERFVSSVHTSYGDALFPEVYDGGELVPWLRMVHADGESVGFVMMAEPTEYHEHPYLWRFLIDRRHQGRGIGRMVLDALVDQAQTWGATELEVSWVPGRGSPGPFYERYGFVPTGEIVDGEVEARLVLRPRC